jgi:hypothetical protein
MATLSLVLDKRRQKKDGTYPLVFQVVFYTVPVKISTGISLVEEDFDKQSGFIKNDKSLNKELFRIEETYRKRLEQFVLKYPKNRNANELRYFILNKTLDELTISEYWDRTIKDLTIKLIRDTFIPNLK